ncbi:MAG: hypothetical protein FWB92_12290, partial [Oscillospiraceae bacterium]|nr:hypothetical protein [Oscillospiraceae bacterium]
MIEPLYHIKDEKSTPDFRKIFGSFCKRLCWRSPPHKRGGFFIMKNQINQTQTQTPFDRMRFTRED